MIRDDTEFCAWFNTVSGKQEDRKMTSSYDGQFYAQFNAFECRVIKDALEYYRAACEANGSIAVVLRGLQAGQVMDSLYNQLKEWDSKQDKQ